MRNTVRTYGIIGAICLAATGAARPAVGGMSVAPLKQEVTVKPGETGKVTITVWNGNRDRQAVQEEITLRIFDVKATEEGGLLFPDPGTVPDSAAKWIKTAKTELLLEPEQSERVSFTISPPQSTPPGEYYAAVMISTVPKPTEGSGVNLQFRTASGIFVTVPGRTFPKQAKIERCEVLWPDTPEAIVRQAANASSEETPAVKLMPRVSVLLRNTGRVRFTGSGKISVQNAASREVFSAPLTSKRACVFGGDSRLFEAVLAKPLPAGKYTIKVEVDYESAWGKARHKMPLEVLPDQAALMASRSRRYQEGQAPIVVEPASIAVTAQPGATRNMALTVRNLKDGLVKGTAAVAAGQGSPISNWISVTPASLAMGKAGRKTVAVRVQVPAGVAGGTYTSAVILKVGSEGSPLLERVVPVEIEVQAER